MKNFKISPKKNDILMTRIGDIGTSSIVTTDEDLAYYVSLALFKCKNISPFFLHQLISSQSFQKELWRRTLHIAFPKKINKGEIAFCKLQLPSLAEQEKIADFLSTFDEKIDNQSNVVDNLLLLKKGFLQQLFC